MIAVRLKNGESREFPADTTIHAIAHSISPGLAKKALAAKLDGRVVDLSCVVTQNSDLDIITAQDPEGVDVIRHSTAHLLAHAVKTLYPDAQVTIGPVIDKGFYYDFSYKRPFTPEDLSAIEAEMARLAAKNLTIERKVIARDDAVSYFKSINEFYKAEIIGAIPADQEVSIYTQGDFQDLCRGPHVPATGVLKVFKLQKVAGAYWRGDSKNEMLQRIYGTAWADKASLDQYLMMLEEAEKRDHRKLGKALDLFHMQDIAPGLIFWHPKGWSIWQAVEQYMRRVYQDNGYMEVKGPQIIDRVLWEKSGHWENYKDNMFTTESENRVYAVKPMNCPGHIQIFRSDLRSYRDLPLRYGEFGQCHRNEPSGSLHGIMRVRGFTQDDGHIFCTEEQIQSECLKFTSLLQAVYKDFGFSKIIYKVATRPEKRVGSDDLWDVAEKALIDALEASNCTYQISKGEGAFYGPKVEYALQDALGREWQCGTVQVDFFMPQRLEAEYVAIDNTRKTPVMIHRAILGSLERFIGILIEHHAGALPMWLAPVQVAVVPISEKHHAYAQKMADSLHQQGLRAQLDLRNEKISYKIRDLSLQKIPYLLVMGDNEVAQNAVSVRMRGNEDLGVMSVEQLLARLRNDIQTKV